MTLTEQAKRSLCGKQHAEQITDEQLDLCLAWVRREVATRQVSDVLNREPTPTLYWVANVLRHSVAAGKITITRNA